ncbi:hypothetical protein BaRGS_00028734 [Batillaria attramentaria]|uniref:Uncharacterized protein n=1 Tax=Batillaria attramentaria TaxID=370345 RepID=A0ABD0JZC5_9CAEN
MTVRTLDRGQEHSSYATLIIVLHAHQPPAKSSDGQSVNRRVDREPESVMCDEHPHSHLWSQNLIKGSYFRYTTGYRDLGSTLAFCAPENGYDQWKH